MGAPTAEQQAAAVAGEAASESALSAGAKRHRLRSTLRFSRVNRLLRPKYLGLLGRYLRHRFLTPSGYRLQTDGMVFLGPRLQLQVGRRARLRVGRFAWIGHGTKIRCHEGEVEIGAKTVMGQECTISSYRSVRIGPECVIADRAMFIDFDHVVVDPEIPVRHQGLYMRPVRVGANVWVGYNAQVLRGVTIGDNAIIGSNAVVTRDIPANAVAVGSPARVVRMRPRPERLRWPDPVEPSEYGPSGPR